MIGCACCMSGIDMSCIGKFCGKILGNYPLRTPSRRWDSNIKLVVKDHVH